MPTPLSRRLPASAFPLLASAPSLPPAALPFLACPPLLHLPPPPPLHPHLSPHLAPASALVIHCAASPFLELVAALQAWEARRCSSCASPPPPPSRVAQGSLAWAHDASSSSCPLCAAPFTLSRRRHHCRCCGTIACNSCSSTRALLRGSAKPARVCTGCVHSGAADAGAREAATGGDAALRTGSGAAPPATHFWIAGLCGEEELPTVEAELAAFSRCVEGGARVLLVLENPFSPAPLSHAMCLAELRAAAAAGCKLLQVALPPSAEARLAAALASEPHGFSALLQCLQRVDAAGACAAVSRKQQQLRAHFEGVPGGCAAASRTVEGLLLPWAEGVGRAALAALPAHSRGTAPLLRVLARLLACGDEDGKAEAEGLLRFGLAACSQELGVGVAESLRCGADLGALLCAQGRGGEGVELLQKAHAASVRVLGEGHASSIAAAETLRRAVEQRGRGAVGEPAAQPS